jgi:hypothetical protein
MGVLMVTNWGALRSLLQYADKEGLPDDNLVTITEVSKNFETLFEFTDAENRDCTIKIFEVGFEKPIRLVKEMELHTRFKKEEK